MERGCLASAPSTPTTFHSKHFHKTQTKSATCCYSYPLSTRNSRPRSRLSVKASNNSFPARKHTVNGHWIEQSDSPAVSYPSWLPKYEELNPTDMLLRQRIVFLGNEIDRYTADFIIGQLLYLDAENSKDIKMFINSPGGSSIAAMGIYDTMKLCKSDVSTICTGIAASMAAFILAAGAKGKRFCMPNSRVMILRAEGVYDDEGEVDKIYMREEMYHGLKQIKILSRVTGKPEEQIERDTRIDFFMNPWEAKEYGLVDEVIDDGKPGLVAPIADPSAPPFPGGWFLWGDGGFVDGRRLTEKDLPSEEKMSQNRKVGSSGGKQLLQ